MKNSKKEIYKHLVVHDWELIISFPSVRGDKIGLDNTCMAHEELRAFFDGEESVFQSLKRFTADIKQKCLWSSANNDHIEKSLKLMHQASTIEVLLKSLKSKLDLSTIPAQVMRTLKADPFIDAIGLDPMYRDNILRYREMSTCSFGIRESEGVVMSLFRDALIGFFKKNKHSIIDNHNHFSATSAELGNATWKRDVLNELSKKIADFQEKQINANTLQMILDFLNTKFKEKKSVHDPEKLFRLSLAKQKYKGDMNNNEEICEYFESVVSQGITCNNIVNYIIDFIEWDNLEVFSEQKVKGVFERIHESGKDFHKWQKARDIYEERMNVAIQFFIATANLVLKRKGKTNYNLGMAIEGVYLDDNQKKKVNEDAAMIDLFITRLGEVASNNKMNFIEQLPNEIIKWMNEKKVQLGINEDISDVDIEEIKSIFSSNFRAIQGSKHFDEFLIRHEGGAIWRSIEGVIATEFRNILKIDLEDNIKVPELGDNIRFLSTESECFANFKSKNNFKLNREISKEDELRERVKHLVNWGFLDFKLDNDETLLMISSKAGYLNIVRDLLNKGAFVDEQNKNGESPLMFAAENGHLDIVKLLLDCNADPNLKSNFKCTALMYTACEGRLDVVNELLKKGALPNEQTYRGDTALMFAAENGHLDVVKVLIKGGASVKQKNKEGRTVLMRAVGEEHLDVVKELIKQGASIDERFENQTPLMLAVKLRYRKIAKVLINAGSNLKVKNRFGESLLDMATPDLKAHIIDRLDKIKSAKRIRDYRIKNLLKKIGNKAIEDFPALRIAIYDAYQLEIYLAHRRNRRQSNAKSRNPLSLSARNLFSSSLQNEVKNAVKIEMKCAQEYVPS